MPTQLPSNLPT